MQKVEVKFEWSGTTRGELTYLYDNNTPLTGSPEGGKGGFTTKTTTAAAPVHYISVGLAFVGKSIKNVSAKARVDGGKWRSLGESDESWHHWKASGPVW